MSNPSFFSGSAAYRDLAEISAEEAAASATAAAASATAAANSASEAEGYVGDTSASADAAAASAAAASSSESNAQGYASDAASSASNSAASATEAYGYVDAAQAVYDTYRGQYYGALSADPSLDPLGNTPTVGDWYFNTAYSAARAYNGFSWSSMTAVLPASGASDAFVATSGQTRFQLSTNGNFYLVFLNGQYLPEANWEVNVETGVYYLDLDPSYPATSGDDVTVTYFTVAEVGGQTTVADIDSESSSVGYVITSNGDGTASWAASGSGGLPDPSGEDEYTRLVSDGSGGWEFDAPRLVNDGTSGQILTSDGAGGNSWETLSVVAANVNSESATNGYVLTADGAGGSAWEAVASGGNPEGTDVLSTGVTDGYVLTADGAGASVWEAVPAGGNPEGTDVLSTGISAGWVLLATGSGTCSWSTFSVDAGDINSGAATSVQVLQADGSGGAAWQTPNITASMLDPESASDGYIPVVGSGAVTYEALDVSLISTAGGSSGDILVLDASEAAWGDWHDYYSVGESDMDSSGATSGDVLVADGSGGASWGTNAPSGANVTSGAATSGQLLTANGSGAASWVNPADVQDGDIDSEAATSGQVLAANGSGGASWTSTLTGDLDNYTEAGSTGLATSGTASVTLDGTLYESTLTGDITGWSLTPPTAPLCGSATVIFEQAAGGYDVTTFPSTWFWASGSEPTMPAASGDKLVIVLYSTPSGDIHASAQEYSVA